MKKTIILSLILSSSVFAELDGTLWSTGLSANGSSPQDAVLTPINGKTEAPDASYLGGWVNDWGPPSELRFPDNPYGPGCILGSDVAGWGDVGFHFRWANIRQEVMISSFKVGTFSWSSEEYDYSDFDVLSIQIYLNGELFMIKNKNTRILVEPMTKPGGATTFIDIAIDGWVVRPGDSIDIVVNVSAYGLNNHGFGMSYIEAIGITEY